MNRSLAALLMLVPALVPACDEDECDVAVIQARLDAASPGDVVSIGSCRVRGALDVPAGVTLSGIGSSQSAIEALPGNIVALTLHSADGLVTAARDLRVQGLADTGLYATGTGAVEISDVAVAVAHGSGVAVDGVSRFDAEDLLIEGPVDESNRGDPSLVTPDPEATAVLGLYLDGVPATLTRLEVRGIALAGVAIRGGTTQLTDAIVRGNLGYGLVAEGGSLTVVDSAFEETWQGARGEPAMALALTDVVLDTERASLADNERYGIVHVGGRAVHRTLSAVGHGDVALWMASLDEARVLAGSSIRDGRFAGLVVADVASATLTSLEVTGIASQRRNVGAGGLAAEVEVGDGVHLVRSDAALTDVSVVADGRAGLVVDLDATVTFEAVLVESSGTALGAIGGIADAGDPFLLVPSAVGGWDTGIERRGAAAVNDAAFEGDLDIVGSSAPNVLPVPPE